MITTQQLGGTRHSSPLDDEMTYPLTEDEYLTIQENLSIDKFSNWESFLLSTGFTSLISDIITFVSGSFEKKSFLNGKEIIELNYSHITSIIIYSVLSFGSFFGFFIYKATKKRSEKPMHRLKHKIELHLKKGNDD